MGVWIETLTTLLRVRFGMSLPMWECGLKHEKSDHITRDPKVTPHVGVWIETEAIGNYIAGSLVTPHVGVWIETYPLAALLLL